MKRSFRQLIASTALATLLCTVSAPASTCEYYADHFKIIHPHAEPAHIGASGVVISLQFTQIESSDRLLGATTPVAERVTVIYPAASGVEQTIALQPGSEVTLTADTAHLQMHGIKTQLHEGRQYELRLMFEKAGAVDVDFIVGDH
jgi:hypothetical protein